MDKTRKTTSSKIWPNLTCAISVVRKGQILLVVGFLVVSTTGETSKKAEKKRLKKAGETSKIAEKNVKKQPKKSFKKPGKSQK